MNPRKPQLIDAVWQHGRTMSEADPAEWRQDACGAWIRRGHFENEMSEFGWKMEKVSPGGPETPENLRPYHVGNSYDLANSRPHCSTTADRSDVPAEKYARPPRNRGA